MGGRLDAGPSRSGRWTWFAVWALFLPLAALRAGTLAESDTFWQVRTGLLTLDAGALPTVDTYAWTVAGQPWTLNSWGFNVLLALGYRLGDLVGVAVVAAGLAMTVVALALAAARRLGASAPVAGALMFAGWLVVVPWLSARPQLVDYVGVLTLVLLLDSLSRSRRPWWCVLGIGLLTVVWTNLHVGALLVVAVTGVCAVVLLLCADTRRAGFWALAATAAAAVGTLVSPYGARTYTHAVVVHAESSATITEWQSPSPVDLTHVAMLVAGVVGIVVAARRRDAVYLAAIGVPLLASVTALRFAPIVLLVSLPILSAALSTPAVLGYLRSRGSILIAGVAAITVALLVLSAPAVGHLGRPEPTLYPRKVHTLIPSGCRVFTTYQMGGFLILTRPDITVNIDSRNDLYGDARVRAADTTLRGRGDIRQALADAGCALVPPESALAAWLEAQPEWTSIGTEPPAALHVKKVSVRPPS